MFNILIVDDKPDNLKLLCEILKSEEYKVRPVPDGMLALQAAEKEKPDLILLDIMMPEMDGFEVCRRLKENQNLSDIPVIFISALSDTNNIVKAFTSGGVDYITKPFYAKEVKARVANHLKIRQQKNELQILNAEKDILVKNLADAQLIARIGSWEWDMISNTVKWSKELYNIYDISPDTFEGKAESLIKAIHPDDVEIFNNSMKNNLINGSSPTLEYRVIHKDGSIHNILAIGIIEYNNAGIPIKNIGTAQDITERIKAEEEKNTLEQLQQLSQHTEIIREKERTAISRELHDDLGQSLTAVKIDLGIIKKTVSDNEVVLKINKVSDLVGETIKTVQRITSQLRPELLDDLGLESAIELYTKEFAQRNGVEILLDLDSELTISPDASLIIFRIMQESLTNVARHSKATQIDIRLGKTNENIYFIISDNGIGITENELKSKKSFGIMGMKERAATLKGTFNIYSKNDHGTEIKLIIPLNN